GCCFLSSWLDLGWRRPLECRLEENSNSFSGMHRQVRPVVDLDPTPHDTTPIDPPIWRRTDDVRPSSDPRHILPAGSVRRCHSAAQDRGLARKAASHPEKRPRFFGLPPGGIFPQSLVPRPGLSSVDPVRAEREMHPNP